MATKSSCILLIWEKIPEETQLYLIPEEEIKPVFISYLTQAHGKFINVDEMNDGLRFLNTALCESDDPADAEDGFEEYLGVLAPHRWMHVVPILDYSVTSVYLSGFSM